MSGSPQISTPSWAEVPLLTPKGFKGLAKGDELPDSCRVSFGIQVGEVEVDPTKRQVRFIGSKSSPDSSDDEIIQSGLNWARFDRNPVFLWSHDAGSPIGVVTAHETSGERVEKTNITVSYFPPEISPLAETAFAMIQYRKQLRALKDRGGAASIGIDPKEWERKDPDDWWSGIIFQKSDVLA